MILQVPPTLRGSCVAHVPFFQAQLMEVQKLLSRHGVSTSNYGREGPCLKEGKKRADSNRIHGTKGIIIHLLIYHKDQPFT